MLRRTLINDEAATPICLSILHRVDWDAQREGRSLTRAARRGKRTVVELDNSPGACQPKTASYDLARIRAAYERFKDALDIARHDADSMVGYRQHRRIAVLHD